MLEILYFKDTDTLLLSFSNEEDDNEQLDSVNIACVSNKSEVYMAYEIDGLLEHCQKYNTTYLTIEHASQLKNLLMGEKAFI